MALLHGSEITAEEIERIVSTREFGPTRFASLCNSLVYALSGQAPLELPSFTERTNVKDGGIDGEWDADFPSGVVSNSSLVKQGWNVYQYKQRDVFARSRDEAFTGLKSEMKSAVKKLYDRTQKRPAAFVVFTNLDLTHLTKATGGALPQKKELQNAILDGYDKSVDVDVQVVGAAELAAFLNSVAQLRSAFFARSEFTSWQDFRDQQITLKGQVFGPWIDLVGRSDELNAIQAAVNDRGCQVIVVFGPHNIGKSRLVVEATQLRYPDIVVALDSSSTSAGDILKLRSPSKEIIVVVDDPDVDDAGALVTATLKTTNVKLILSIPQADNAPPPNFGQESRIRPFQLKPLLSEPAGQLLKKVNPSLDHSLQSWILEQAGGNPGVILVAGRLGQELRQGTRNFRENVGSTFGRRVETTLGKEYLTILGLCSLMTAVGVLHDAQAEIALICRLMGGSIDVNKVVTSLERLIKAGLLHKRGSYVEVVPRIFADYLASQTIKGRSGELFALVSALPSRAIARLFERLHSVENDEVELLWDKLLGNGGPFDSLEKAIELGDLLRLIAARKPERVAAKLDELASTKNSSQLRQIEGDARRDLMWSIDQLLFREASAETALKLLKIFAVAETEEHISNNATGVFCECFIYWHPQFPLSLPKRLGILQDLITSERTDDSVRLGLKAIIAAQSHSGISFRSSTSSSPLSSRPIIINQEMWDYNEALIDLLIMLAESDRPGIAAEASSSLPTALRLHSDEKRLTELVKRAQKIMVLWQNKKIEINTSEFAASLHSIKEDLDVVVLYPDLGPEKQKFETALNEINTLIELIDKGTFSDRVKRWTGGWSRSSQRTTLEDGTVLYGDENDIRTLASQAVANPDLLDANLLVWLTSDAAKQGHTFLEWVGRLDTTNALLTKIERHSEGSSGISALEDYFWGWTRRSKVQAEDYLETVERARKLEPAFYLSATRAIGGNKKGVERIIRLIQGASLDPITAERTLKTGGWSSTLDPSDFLNLLQAIGGALLENANSVLDFFSMWLLQEKPVVPELEEYIWKCLETCPTANLNDAYDMDKIATRLLASNTERGFALFEKLLTQPYEKHSWDPLDHAKEKGFFESLKKLDSTRTWAIILGILQDERYRYDVEHSVSRAIDLVSDSPPLLDYAKSGKEKAIMVIDLTNASQSGFWEFAEQMVALYPGDQDVEKALMASVDPFKSGGFSGSYAGHLEDRRSEAAKRIPTSEVPFRDWLVKVERTYGELVPKALATEMDEDINGFRRYHQDEFGQLKLWAVASLVRAKQYELLKKVITLDQLNKLLPSLELSNDEQKELLVRFQ